MQHSTQLHVHMLPHVYICLYICYHICTTSTYMLPQVLHMLPNMLSYAATSIMLSHVLPHMLPHLLPHIICCQTHMLPHLLQHMQLIQAAHLAKYAVTKYIIIFSYTCSIYNFMQLLVKLHKQLHMWSPHDKHSMISICLCSYICCCSQGCRRGWKDGSEQEVVNYYFASKYWAVYVGFTKVGRV